MGVKVKVKWLEGRYRKELYKYTDGKMYQFAFKVMQMAKLLSPVDTGKLRESIGILKMGKLKYIVFSSLNYAIYVELGTSKKAPQPFLRPAITRSKFLNIL